MENADAQRSQSPWRLRLQGELRLIALAVAIILGCFLGGALLSFLLFVVFGWLVLGNDDYWPSSIGRPALALGALSVMIAVTLRGRVLLLFPILSFVAGFIFWPLPVILVYFALGGEFNND
jgi:hypothetical protein